jgi:hypothetical protein
VQVTVLSPDERPLVFDGTDTLVPNGPSYSIALKASSEHTCVMSDGRSVSFHVGEKPGLLDLDSSAFVVFSVDYRSKPPDPRTPKIVVGHVLVDSFLVYRKPFPSDHMDDATALRIAGILQKQGNFAEVIMPMARKSLKSYPTSKEVAGVRWIGPALFIERFWDIDLGAEIPSSITADVQKGFEDLDSERQLTAIMEARSFLLFASLSPEIYEVVDLRPLWGRQATPSPEHEHAPSQ